MSDSPLPCVDDLLAAAARIAPHASVTPVLQSHVLDGLAGASLAFKAEHLQRGGAFKFRGACNAVWSLEPVAMRRGNVPKKSPAAQRSDWPSRTCDAQGSMPQHPPKA